MTTCPRSSNPAPCPSTTPINVAKQIAEGLEEAHENGIVHRDLKPANVKRTPDGKVKILDFGLAMAMAGQSSAEEDSVTSMATLTAAMTQAGMILGTAAYMSPEQARGLPVDRRTDIWAFGVIFFEMLTGRRLFEGETVTDTLAGILKTDPDWDSLPDNLPHQVERVIRRCLTRNARQRLRDIGEARVRLEDPDAESGVFTGPVRPIQIARATEGAVPALGPARAGGGGPGILSLPISGPPKRPARSSWPSRPPKVSISSSTPRSRACRPSRPTAATWCSGESTRTARSCCTCGPSIRTRPWPWTGPETPSTPSGPPTAGSSLSTTATRA